MDWFQGVVRSWRYCFLAPIEVASFWLV